MPAKYFDVYIRQAGPRFHEMDTVLSSNLLVGWDKIGVAPEKSLVKAEPITTPVGDGCSICDGFNIVVETGEKTVANWRFAELRGSFHNQLCDFLFIDHEQPAFAIAVFGLKCQVYLSAVSGESATIAINAAALKTAEVALTSAFVFTDKMTPSCLVEIVCANDLGHGVPGVNVSLTVSSPSRVYTAVTDGVGIARLLVETPASPTTTVAAATVTGVGMTWQTGRQVTISHAGKYPLRVEGAWE